MSLASELNYIASEVVARKTSLGASAITAELRRQSRLAAQDGRFSIEFFLKDKGWTRAFVEESAVELRTQGFTVDIVNEITNWYSNTDYDTQELVKVSWK